MQKTDLWYNFVSDAVQPDWHYLYFADHKVNWKYSKFSGTCTEFQKKWTLRVYYTDSDDMPVDCSNWFKDFQRLKMVYFYLNSSHKGVGKFKVSTTNMSGMFQNCPSLEDVAFDVSLENLNNTDNMFNNCPKLKYVNFARLADLSHIRGTNMFSGCVSITNWNGAVDGKDKAKWYLDGGYISDAGFYPSWETNKAGFNRWIHVTQTDGASFWTNSGATGGSTNRWCMWYGQETIYFSPAAEREIRDVKINGVSKGAISSYSPYYGLWDQTTNHTIQISCGPRRYNITSSSNVVGGTVSGTGKYDIHSSATVTITPNEGYLLKDVKIDNVSKGAINSYTFTNITTDHSVYVTWEKKQYALSVSYEGSGSVDPYGTTYMTHGEDKQVTFLPIINWKIKKLFIDGTQVVVPDDNKYTFTSVTQPHTVHVVFSEIGNKITISNITGHGTITPAGPTELVEVGEDITFTMTPDEHYEVADILVDGISQGALDTYTFTAVTAEHSIAVSFQLKKHTITINKTEYGTVTPTASEIIVIDGEDQSFTIQPDSECYIKQMKVDGIIISPSGTYTFYDVVADHVLDITFDKYKYQIAVTCGLNGAISPAGPIESVNTGSDKAFTITPDSGYEISQLIIDGVSITPALAYTFVEVSANHTIEAQFTRIGHHINVTCNGSGTVDPCGPVVVVLDGEHQTFNFTPDFSAYIKSVKVDGIEAGKVSTYTFTLVNRDHDLEVTFTKVLHSINVSYGEHGTITPAGPIEYYEDSESATFTITPDETYQIKSLIVDSESVPITSTYTFTNIMENHSIAVEFEKITHKITIEKTGPGTVSPAAGDVIVNDRENLSISFTPDELCRVQFLYIDGVSINPMELYTFVDVREDHVLRVEFDKIRYNISSSATKGGTITPAGDTSVVVTGMQKYEITGTDSKYKYMKLLVDGVNVGTPSEYTFTDVRAPHTIKAVFAKSSSKIWKDGGGVIHFN